MQTRDHKISQQDQSSYTPFSSVPQLFKSTISTQPPPPQLQQQIRKIRREYQTKIIQLQNEVKYLKEDVEYKQDAHQRQMENLKAVLQYQYTVKIRDIKAALRDEYAGFLAEGTALRDKNKYLEEEIRLLRLKYERSQKYCKQIQILSQQKLQKQYNKFQQQLTHLQKTTQTLKHSLQKQKEQEQKEQSMQIQKLKQQLIQVQNKQKQKEQKIEQLQKNIQQLTRQIKLKVVQQEELRIQKDKIIQDISARLVVFREANVMEEVRVRKENRDGRLREIEGDVGRIFGDQGRNMFNTIDVYRNDLQKQILLEKEMKKRWQTQTSVKSQIKKINGRKRSSTNDLSESCSRRQASVADSPRFGIQARLDFDLC